MIKKLTKKGELAFHEGRLLLILFCIYTLAVKFIGREPIGPNDSKVGFAGLNKWFQELMNYGEKGYNEAWYQISKFFGVLVILTAVMFAVLGLIELIRRRNIWKVDMNYYSLALFYIVVGVVYVFFGRYITGVKPFSDVPAEVRNIMFPSPSIG